MQPTARVKSCCRSPCSLRINDKAETCGLAPSVRNDDNELDNVARLTRRSACLRCGVWTNNAIDENVEPSQTPLSPNKTPNCQSLTPLLNFRTSCKTIRHLSTHGRSSTTLCSIWLSFETSKSGMRLRHNRQPLLPFPTHRSLGFQLSHIVRKGFQPSSEREMPLVQKRLRVTALQTINHQL
jgi:hypothetical protein